MNNCICLLRCPVCDRSLTKVGDTLQCSSQHSFDIAREGYVNLLRKKVPGDTKEMLVARRNFLERGYYDALSNMLNELVSTCLMLIGNRGWEDWPQAILDAGCGEGYYLSRLKHSLDRQLSPQAYCYLGLDSSKEAVRMAAKKYRDIDFLVANINEQLVLAENSVQVLLNIFAPRNPAEFARVIAPKGLLFVVIPNPKHLKSLRSTLRLLNIEENKKKRVVEQFAEAFQLLAAPTVEYEVWLSGEEVRNIVLMSPNYWHVSQEKLDALEGRGPFQTEVDFTCLMFSSKK